MATDTTENAFQNDIIVIMDLNTKRCHSHYFRAHFCR